MSEHELDEEQLPSKSQRKREAHWQQAMGEQLTQLKPAQLQSLELSEPLLQGIAEYQRLPNSHGARRRQLQYLGKLMRHVDIEALAAKLSKLESPQAEPQHSDLAAMWNEKIQAEGNAAIQTLLETQPQLDRQKLRQLYRKLLKAEDQKDREKHRNRLLAYLSDLSV
jgi:ribosome-associated protein